MGVDGIGIHAARTVDNLWHIFTDFYGGQYAPLAFLSYLVYMPVSAMIPFIFICLVCCCISVVSRF